MTSMVQFAQTIQRLNAAAPLMPSANAEPLTTDAIILMCGSRLRSLDDQIQTNLNKQEVYKQCTTNVNSMQSLLACDSQGDGVHDPNDIKRVNDALDDAIASAPEGSSVRKGLSDLKDDFKKKGAWDKGQCAAFAQRAGDLSKEINSAAELDMITVNSRMSQRQTAVQLFNNLLTALGETQKSLAASIGK